MSRRRAAAARRGQRRVDRGLWLAAAAGLLYMAVALTYGILSPGTYQDDDVDLFLPQEMVAVLLHRRQHGAEVEARDVLLEGHLRRPGRVGPDEADA